MIRRDPPVECYRTMIRDRFVCLDRWPTLWRKWCPGCGRMARVASRLANSRSTTMGRNGNGRGAALTAPDLADAHVGGDDG